MLLYCVTYETPVSHVRLRYDTVICDFGSFVDRKNILIVSSI